jgi:hypothetical protein
MGPSEVERKRERYIREDHVEEIFPSPYLFFSLIPPFAF